MGQEIERKWLVSSLTPQMTTAVREQGVFTQQGYLSVVEGASMRIRRTGDKAWCTMKQGSGVSRIEHEFAMDPEEAGRIIGTLNLPPIEKRRLKIPSGTSHPWELDVFQGHLVGLIFLELELDTVDSPVPAWPDGVTVVRELTGEISNADLAAMSATEQRALVASLRPPATRRTPRL